VAVREEDAAVLRLALVGDLIATRDLRAEADDDLLAVAEVLRSADCAIGNLEMTLHDFDVPAAVAPGGLWLGARPERAADLAWLGIDAVSRANNHAGDYGVGGMQQTERALASAGIAHSGCGPDLASARRPVLVPSPDGVVALISCTATFPLSSMAGPARPPMPGRPGISPLRRVGDRLVEPAEALARTGASLAELRSRARASGVTYPPHLLQSVGDPAPVLERDAAEILAAVTSARGEARAVVVSVHVHDHGATEAEPAPAIVDFARRCIDAGADVVACHGTHVVRGVEMHAGRPILLGLGSLVFQPDTVPHLPEEAYLLHGLGPEAGVADVFARRWGGGDRGLAGRPSTWQGLIALVTLEDDRASVDLMPVDLRGDAPSGSRGTPRLAR
jgi:poly-gamma-glutamate synthesis protein (capsule biosynthesis protein)